MRENSSEAKMLKSKPRPRFTPPEVSVPPPVASAWPASGGHRRFSAAAGQPLLTGVAGRQAWAKSLDGIDTPVRKLNELISDVALSVLDYGEEFALFNPHDGPRSLDLVFFAMAISSFALRFSPPEYFLLAVLGITMSASLGGTPLKALGVAVWGPR